MRLVKSRSDTFLLSVAVLVACALAGFFVVSVRTRFMADQVRVGFRLPEESRIELTWAKIFYKTPEDAVFSGRQRFGVAVNTDSPSAVTWFNLPLNATEFRLDLNLARNIDVAGFPVEIIKAGGTAIRNFGVVPRRPTWASSIFKVDAFRCRQLSCILRGDGRNVEFYVGG